MNEWRMVIDHPRPGTQHMALDARLAQEGRWAARFFTWHPGISLGWKQPVPEWLDASAWHAAGLDLVERPTGGGIAFHGSDVSISVVVPRSVGRSVAELLGAVCRSAGRLCESYGFEARCACDIERGERMTYCLTEPSPYAVFLGEKKVAGFALRRYPESWLIQGSLLVNPIPGKLAEALPHDVIESLRERAMPLLQPAATREEELMERWADCWTVWWEEALQAAALTHAM